MFLSAISSDKESNGKIFSRRLWKSLSGGYHVHTGNQQNQIENGGGAASLAARHAGGGLFGAAVGHEMLPKHHSEGFLYFDNIQPQRIGGYYNFYESFTSNNIACNIDSLRTDFTNSKGKTSSIWLWKGNYNMVFNGGWHIGAEVGAYGPHGGADDNMLESVSFTLKDKTTGKSVNRSVSGQYWTNRFDKGKCIPSNLFGRRV